ncbi:hypothetical protein FHW37_11196 [Neorhizobium alkalisoli]|uniref:Uncharacterized protein n=1 Tax=Neorhizobium alkalisoli TaxID=528178 RepID=A0A561QB61_9HYPH|nr:hypothetical protein FHW37_11196 [Neorhizobium alkalisoli]
MIVILASLAVIVFASFKRLRLTGLCREVPNVASPAFVAGL